MDFQTMFQAAQNQRAQSRSTFTPTTFTRKASTTKLNSLNTGGVFASMSSGNNWQSLSCMQAAQTNLKRELWSYLGLLGVFCIYFGVIVGVYALKGVLGPNRGAITFCGIFLAGFGGMNLFISLSYYRFQKRHKRFSCFADEHSEEHLMPKPTAERAKATAKRKSSSEHLTLEFAKYAEFSARDRRYDSRRSHFFKSYDHSNIDFVRKYWLEQQKPHIGSGILGIGNPSFLFPASPPNFPEAPVSSGTGSPTGTLTNQQVFSESRGPSISKQNSVSAASSRQREGSRSNSVRQRDSSSTSSTKQRDGSAPPATSRHRDSVTSSRQRDNSSPTLQNQRDTSLRRQRHASDTSTHASRASLENGHRAPRSTEVKRKSHSRQNSSYSSRRQLTS